MKYKLLDEELGPYEPSQVLIGGAAFPQQQTPAPNYNDLLGVLDISTPEKELESQNKDRSLFAHLNMAANEFIKGATGFDAPNTVAKSILDQVKLNQETSKERSKRISDYLRLNILNAEASRKNQQYQEGMAFKEKELKSREDQKEKDRAVDQQKILVDQENKELDRLNKDPGVKKIKENKVEWETENRPKLLSTVDSIDQAINELESNPIHKKKDGAFRVAVGLTGDPSKGGAGSGLAKTMFPEQYKVLSDMTMAALPVIKQNLSGSTSDKDLAVITNNFYNPGLPIEQRIRSLKEKRDALKTTIDSIDKKYSLEKQTQFGRSDNNQSSSGWSWKVVP